MDEKEIINQAFGAELTTIYKIFSGSVLVAKGDTEQELAAEKKFRAGVESARRTRNRALALLDQS